MPTEIAPSDPSHPQPSASQPPPPPPTHASPNPTSKTSSSSPAANINSILETGRRRSEALGLASTSRLTDADVQRLALHDGIPTDDAPMDGSSSTDEHTPDERTAIVARERAARANGDGEYGTTAEGTKRVRSRNSQLSLTRARSRAQSQQSQSRQRRGSAVPTSANNQQATGGEKEQPWWKKQLEKYGSLELENKGSVARDHLALERTFLAWLRTSLAFASIGIAITQLFRLNTTISPSEGTASEPSASAIHFRSLGKPLGAAFLGISIVVLLIGFHRYFEAQHWVTKGKFPASRGSIAIVAAVAGALMVTSLVVVIVVEPRAR